jgi:hypothetical protein
MRMAAVSDVTLAVARAPKGIQAGSRERACNVATVTTATLTWTIETNAADHEIPAR